MILAATKDLAAAVSRAKQVCRQNSPLPILGHLRLAMQGDELCITACDTECQIAITLPAQGDAEAFCVDAERLAQSLVGDETKLARTDGRATIQGGRSCFKLPTLPAEQWPSIEATGPSKARLRAEWVAEAIEACLPAVNPKEPRFHFRGINFRSNGEHVEVSAGCAFVMLQWGLDIASKPFDFILPRRACEIIAKLSPTVLTVHDRAIALMGDDFEFTSKLVDAQFPAGVEKIYPKATGECALSRQELTDCVTRVVPFSEVAQGAQKVNGVRLVLGAEELQVMASNWSAETTMGLAQNSHNGTALDRHYQAQYLKMLLKLIPAKEIVLKWDDRGIMMAEHGNVKGVITPFNY